MLFFSVCTGHATHPEAKLTVSMHASFPYQMPIIRDAAARDSRLDLFTTHLHRH